MSLGFEEEKESEGEEEEELSPISTCFGRLGMKFGVLSDGCESNICLFVF